MKHPLLVASGGSIVDPAGGLFTPFGGSAVLEVEPQMLRNGDAPYHGELQYLGLLAELLERPLREDRTGTGTRSVFGRQIRFDLNEGFPLLTTKKVWWKGVVAELLWMLSGSTNIEDLTKQGVHIWDEWADETGELGPVYGAQWRSWGAPMYDGETYFGGVDQIEVLLKNLREKPYDRGHVVSAWDAAALGHMALRPCHCLFQFYVDDDKLSCQLYQRSADIFLGVPFNIASYALLTHLIARELDLGVGEFVHTFGDLHLYANHVEQAKEQLSRCPRPFPSVTILNHGNDFPKPSLFNIEARHIDLHDYDPHPAIKGEVSV